MDEPDDLTKAAERWLRKLGEKLRSNLVPPVLRSLRHYDNNVFQADLLAGLIIVALTIPQSVTFALLIGFFVPAVVACAIVGTMLYSFGFSSRHLVFGPTNTISIILAGALPNLSAEPLDPMQKMLLIGFLMRAIQLVAGLASFGQITQFVSRSVSVGDTIAVGILSATGQPGNLIGAGFGAMPGSTSFLRSVTGLHAGGAPNGR